MSSSLSKGTTAAHGEKSSFAAKAVIFDLDGTLIHTAPDLVQAVNLMRRDMDMPELANDLVMTWIGNGAVRLVKRALTESWDAEPDADLFARGHALFHDHYLRGVSEHSEPYPDVREALNELRARGLRMACVTNKPVVFTEPLLEELELDQFFDSVLSGDSLAEKKPHPLPLQHVCELFRVAAEDAIVVGDSANDIKAAKAAGLRVICVNYGYSQGVDLTKLEPDAMIDSFRELTDIIRLTA